MRIGLFGGSFNPIHHGHTSLANELCVRGEVDEVWMLVSPQNPLKQNAALSPEMDRLEMARLATKGYPRISVSDVEFMLSRPSFTAHTLEYLRERYPEHRFILIIGADNWQNFEHWYKPEEILRYHNIIVYPREGYELSQEKMNSRAKLVDTPLFPISSTEIRKKIRKNEDVGQWLCPEVVAYIAENRLYTT